MKSKKTAINVSKPAKPAIVTVSKTVFHVKLAMNINKITKPVKQYNVLKIRFFQMVLVKSLQLLSRITNGRSCHF